MLQLLSRSWPRDISKELVKFSSTTTVQAFSINSLDSSKVPCMVDNIDWELDKVTLIELFGYTLLKQFTSTFL